MKLAIMQPYFFPYLGYFSLINYVDKWIVFDPTQYIRKGWINRNRVLKNGKGVKYIRVKVKKHHLTTSIKDIYVDDSNDWRESIYCNLDYYKNRAPYYSIVVDFLKDCFNTNDLRINYFNTRLLKKSCEYLNIPFNYEIYSEMQLEHKVPSHAGEWALHISKALGASVYVNPPNGREIFQKSQFDANGIKLSFLEQTFTEYNQKIIPFEPGLSIIDVMMFNTPKQISEMLKKFTLFQA